MLTNEQIKAENDLLFYFRQCNDLQKRFIISTALDCVVTLKMYDEDCARQRKSIEMRVAGFERSEAK